MNARVKLGTILAGAALAATTLFGGTAAAGSPNLVQNGDFTFNTKGWYAFAGAAITTNFAQEGATVSNVANNSNETTVKVFQCIPLPDGTEEIAVSGRARIAAGQHRDGFGRLGVTLHTSMNCDESQPIAWSDTIDEIGSWNQLAGTVDPTGLPDTVRSVGVQLYVTKQVAKPGQWSNAPFDVEFDDISMTVTATPEEPAVCLFCEPEPEGPAAEEPEPAGPAPVEPAQPIEPVDDSWDDEPAAPQPLEPVLPGDDDPTTADEPAAADDSPAAPATNDSPAAPGAPASKPKPAKPAVPASEDGSQQPTTDSTDNTEAEDGTTNEPAAPAKPDQAKPMQTPAAPATGDSGRLPADEAQDSSDAAASDDTNSSNGSGPMPLVGGGLAGLASLLILGLLLKRRRREESEA